MGDELTIRLPKEGQALRMGRTFDVVIDAKLEEPWFEAPRLGAEIATINGQGHRGLDFESTSVTGIKSPIAGTARVQDTKSDCHMERALGNEKAGRGYEVVLSAGAVELCYGHLKRGSARQGTVKVGEAVGLPGNTGRCVDGCGRHFVHFEVKKSGVIKDVKEFTAPIEAEALVNGKLLGSAQELPIGQVELREWKLGQWMVDRRFTPDKPCQIEVRLRRGQKVIAKVTQKVKVTQG